jgi:hypothetical protein
MVSALEYHYERFVEITSGKAAKAPLDNDFERYEAVAYINRLGQFTFFACSKYVTSHISDAPDRIASAKRLLPFRNKYSAHRSIDDPRSERFSEQVGHEMSLGLVGGSLWKPRSDTEEVFRKPDESIFSETWRRSQYANWFVLYQIWAAGQHLEFNLEVEHPQIRRECCELLANLIEQASMSTNG